jgi:hypothetical protein
MDDESAKALITALIQGYPQTAPFDTGRWSLRKAGLEHDVAILLLSNQRNDPKLRVPYVQNEGSSWR